MQLNSAQTQAIEHPKGPLLIIAGAGTGKTTVITSRIVHLIEKRRHAPSQIVALTFTEKAAEEMRSRVDLMLPLGYEELWIKTFHGFCDRILREYGHETGLDPGYRLLTGVQQWMFLKKRIFNMDLAYYRPLSNPARFIHMLLNHFQRLKDEDISPEAYAAAAVTEQEKELAHAYGEYQRLMMAENFLDFGDLIFYTLRLLEKRPNVLKELQKRFVHILVDEFQDTNYAQTKLTMLLAKKHKNITVVGDDDQSIYRWRGASLSNILAFEKTFPKAKKIVLTENYRSTQAILDASYELIQNNNPERLEIRAAIDKRLRSQKGFGAKPEIWHFDNFLEEAMKVVETIENEMRSDLHGKSNRRLADSSGSNRRFADFAILVRANQHAKPFMEELKRRDIPFQVRSPQGFFHLEEIKDLIAMLRVIRNFEDAVAWYRILNMPIFGIQMPILSKTIQEAQAVSSHILELPGLASEFSKVRSLIEDLREYARYHSVGQVIARALQQSGYLKKLMEDNTAASREKIQNISGFSELVKRFEMEQSDHGVRDFLAYLELVEESDSPAPLSGGLENTFLPDEDAVQILTVHAGKGLEFPWVFVVNSVKDRFPTMHRKEPLEIPELLVHEKLPNNDYHIQEERRLMYVACTRAEQHLIHTYSNCYEGKKQWKISPFLDELRKEDSSIFKDFSAVKSSMPLLEPRLHRGIPTTPKVIHLSKISFSQLDMFQTCPLKFQFRYLLHLPVPPSHAMSFGSSVHETLNDFYQKIKKGVTPSLELLHECYEQHWIPYGYENRTHLMKRQAQGLEILKNFYRKNFLDQAPIIPTDLERNFHLKIGDFTMSGRIDRIDQLPDKTYEVIDYKTGTSLKDRSLKSNLQLSIYALACQELFQLPVSRLSLYFLEENEKVSTTRTPEELRELRKELEKLVTEMRESDFAPTPGYYCRFCDFRLVCPAV